MTVGPMSYNKTPVQLLTMVCDDPALRRRNRTSSTTEGSQNQGRARQSRKTRCYDSFRKSAAEYRVAQGQRAESQEVPLGFRVLVRQHRGALDKDACRRTGDLRLSLERRAMDDESAPTRRSKICEDSQLPTQHGKLLSNISPTGLCQARSFVCATHSGSDPRLDQPALVQLVSRRLGTGKALSVRSGRRRSRFDSRDHHWGRDRRCNSPRNWTMRCETG